MEPVDLLLITWNRREYVEKTLENLLADPSDFRLYFWDNASEDGTADLIAGIDDPRVEERHFSKENVMQRPPCLWFFETAKGDLCGKIDDDILLPHGWTHTIAPMLRSEPRLGMVGCWIFMPEDYDEEKARQNIVKVGAHEVLRVLTGAGQSFLARREVLRRHIVPPGHTHGFPVDQTAMSLAGMINGFAMPLLVAHNMDDPRSEHCMMRRSKTIGAQAALTARKRGFETPEEYTAWITADARKKLGTPMREQLRRARLARDHSVFGRVRRRIDRVTRRLRRAS
jgi:hypothetical protein